MKRIRLSNTVFEGQNNVYLLGAETDSDVTLVDTGVATPETREELRTGLAEHGLTFSDVDRIFLTHWHYDHAALAGEIQQVSGATVYVHEADAAIVEQDEDALAAMEARQRGLFDEWGMPAAKQEELLEFFEYHAEIRGEPATVETFTDGDRFDVGAVELEVVHAPGHTAGLSGFAFDGESGREIFIGDAVLPKYTPNVGGADVRVDDPLAEYLATLNRLIDGGFTRAWPGHRDEIDEFAERARTIVDHHRERTRRVLDVVRRQEPVDTWTVSAELFGSLESIHILHGPGEAHAHLDHLAREGIVESTPEGYVLGPDVEAAEDRFIRTLF